MNSAIGSAVKRFLPVFAWGGKYNAKTFADDGVAAAIVTVLLIPQALAYSIMAGLPPEAGLYASMLPAVLYAIFGTSMSISIGPTALLAMMTATAVGGVAAQGTPQYVEANLVLTVMSGLIILILGIFRLGFITNFLSHSVISGFMTASAIVIASSQIKHMLGIKAEGDNLIVMFTDIFRNLSQTNVTTASLSAISLAMLLLSKRYAKRALMAVKIREPVANIMARTGPMVAVVVCTVAVWLLGLDKAGGVKVVGDIPKGLPEFTMPSLDRGMWSSLFGSAMLFAMISLVETVSIAKTFAAKRKERIDTNQEFLGLGASNVAAAFTGGCAVTGSFSRSAVNFDAGARTPAVGVYAAVGIGVITTFFTPALYYLPQATLAATIALAVLHIADFPAVARAWKLSKRDFIAMVGTILITFGFGIEQGLIAGFVVSVLLHLYHSSRPYFAVVGLVPGTQHFRSVERMKALTSKEVLSVRVDESLYFANAGFLEDLILDMAAKNTEAKHIVLMFSSVSNVDASALECLYSINRQLADYGISLHLSEVKWPVMRRLKTTDFLQKLSGKVFLSQYAAIAELSPEVAELAKTMKSPEEEK